MAPRKAKQIEDPRGKPLDHEELLRRYDDSKKTRLAYEGDWWVNLAYISGEQNVRFAPQAGHLVEVEDEGDEASDIIVHNVLMKLTRIERAKILKTQPIPTVLPGRDEDEDLMTARVLESYAQQLMWEWKFPRRLRTGTFWIVSTGNVFYKWYWEVTDPDANKGHNAFEVVPPFEMYPDPYATRFEDCRWVIHERFYDMESAWEKYADLPGAKLEHLSQSETEPLRPVEHRIYGNLGLSETRNLDGIVVRELWERPSRARPKGAWVVFTSSGIVYESDFPYDHGRIPYTHAGHIERSNSKWYASVIDYERSMQDMLNRREWLIGYNLAISNGKWYIPPGLDLNADPDGKPGQILRASGTGAPQGVEPKMIEVNSLPNWALQEPDRIKTNMQDIAGQHEVSNATAPGRVEAASAIQLLQESDDSVMKDTIHSQEESIAEGFWQSFMLAKQYGDPEMIVRTYDSDGMIEVKTLYTDKIDLSVQVRVKTTTSLPQSISGKWDRVINLVDHQIITPPEARGLLDLSTDNPDIDPTVDDRKWAYRENEIMSQGDASGPARPLQAGEQDDHAIHIDQHKRYMKTAEFHSLPQQVQQFFLFHIATHRELQKKDAQYEAELQAILAGGTPPEGGGAPPTGEPPGPNPAPPGTPDGGPPEVMA